MGVEHHFKGGEGGFSLLFAEIQTLNLQNSLKLHLNLKVFNGILLKTPQFAHNKYYKQSYKFKITNSISMIEPSYRHSPPLPFADIINTQLHKIYDEVQENVLKQFNILQVESCSNVGDKESQEVDLDLNQREKTVRREPNCYKPEFLSTQTINDQHQAPPTGENDELDFDLFSNLPAQETAHILRLQSEFSQITTHFLALARKMKMVMCQHTDSFITVKKGLASSCKCIFKLWGEDQPDAIVYQLRRYGRGKEAKLIMVEGDDMLFHNFYLAFLRVLEEKKLAKISPGARVQLLFDEQSGQTFNCAKLCDKMHKKACKNKSVSQQSLNYVVQKLKNESMRLKKIIYMNEELKDLNTLERQLETLCFQTTNIVPLFDQIYSKEHNIYRQKREQLLRKHPISQLFRQLEIIQHYNQFRRLRSQKEISCEEKIPYMPAIKQLAKLANMANPSAGYEAILVFRERVRQCYNNYFKNCLRLADMDDYLPVTIFCVLAVDCPQNLLGIVKLLLIEVSTAEDSEWQKKTLTDLEAAFDYIIKQWKVAK